MDVKIYLSNRAAVHLKSGQYSKSIDTRTDIRICSSYRVAVNVYLEVNCIVIDCYDLSIHELCIDDVRT